MDEIKRKRLSGVYALLSTLNETGWMPRSFLHIALSTKNAEHTLEDTLLIERWAQNAGYVEVGHEVTKITEAGREKTKELDRMIAKARGEASR